MASILSSNVQLWSDFKREVLSDWTDVEVLLLVGIMVLTGLILYLQLSETFGRLRKYFGLYYILSRLPFIKGKLNTEFNKASADFAAGLPKSGFAVTRKLPKEGLKMDKLIQRLTEFGDLEINMKRKGQYSGSVFSVDEELMRINSEVANMFMFSELSQPQLHMLSKQLENEVIQMMVSLYKGTKNTCGIATSGGSESLQNAVLAHKLYYRRKKGITEPEVIICETAHAALNKACDFYGVKLHWIDVAEKYQFNLEGVIKAINKNTVMIVTSGPNYVYGTMDPLAPLAKICKEKDIGLHLDACMGGFLVPFANELGVSFPEKEYNFTVDGLTSISADPHKYGLTAKGISVLMFADHEIQKSLYFAKADGPGPAITTGTISDTRNAAIVAACWATFMYYGYNGYKDIARQVVEATRKFVREINAIPGLKVAGNPEIGNVAVISIDKTLDIYKVGNYVNRNDWKITCTPKYPCLHLTLHPNNIRRLDHLIKTIADGVAAVRKDPKEWSKGPNTIMEMMRSLPPHLASKAMQHCYHQVFTIDNFEVKQPQSSLPTNKKDQ